ncbi:MAG: hypothetical protein JWM33_2409, partial [Caulobacteraceae bacterium]|nr:hypothetical protein [Caulobacteraceae bacterium]
MSKTAACLTSAFVLCLAAGLTTACEKRLEAPLDPG